jgi:hypothetical protein
VFQAVFLVRIVCHPVYTLISSIDYTGLEFSKEIRQLHKYLIRLTKCNPRSTVTVYECSDCHCGPSGWFICPPGAQHFLALSEKELRLASWSDAKMEFNLLFATLRNPVGEYIILAWALVKSEDYESWNWFLLQLRLAFGSSVRFISNLLM